MFRNVLVMALALMALAGCSSVPKVLGSQPLRFQCPDLGNYVYDYDHRLFGELQKRAYDPGGIDNPKLNTKSFTSLADELALQMKAEPGRGVRMLVLSGGGQWGAFGAGFLNAQPEGRRKFDVVTGISTGAIQALFVGADDYDLMARLYGLDGIENPASKNGFRIVTRGSEHDITPLRNLLIATLDPAEGKGLLEKIAARDGKPEIWIGLVEGRSTRLKIVRLSQYIVDNYRPGETKEQKEERRKVAECVAGVALGSSSIPLRLTPVQIAFDEAGAEWRTFMDGGVRLSVIDELVVDAAQQSYAMSLCSQYASGQDCTRKGLFFGQESPAVFGETAPEIYVVRNGPTIVPKGKLDTEIDRDPDAYTTAMRGYSVLVNQNELASITELQSRNRAANFFYVSADGYNWITSPEKSGGESRVRCKDRDEDIYFDKEFMQCLRKYGVWRRSNIDFENDGWQVLGTAGDDKSGIVTIFDIPDDDVLKHAEVLLGEESR